MASVKVLQSTRLEAVEGITIIDATALEAASMEAAIPTEYGCPAGAPIEQPSQPLSVDEVWAAIQDDQTHTWLTETVARHLDPAIDRSLVDDIVHDVCVHAASRTQDGELAPREGFRGWLYRSAYRAVQSAAHSPQAAREVSLDAIAATPGQHERLLTDDGALEQQLVTKLVVADAIGQLSERHQESLDLWRAGQSNTEMAAAMGITPDNARRRLQQAQRLFRRTAQYLDLV